MDPAEDELYFYVKTAASFDERYAQFDISTVVPDNYDAALEVGIAVTLETKKGNVLAFRTNIDCGNSKIKDLMIQGSYSDSRNKWIPVNF